jgi:CheY-like chemotaxis protein
MAAVHYYSMSAAIEVKSVSGEGTTSDVFFKPTTAWLQQDLVDEYDEPAGGEETIMVVEDEDSAREFIVRALSLAGYTTLEAKDGIQAIERLQQNDQAIDLILTDILLPMMNGVEFGKLAMAQSPDTKLVYMTGYQTESEATDPDLTLRKPFKHTELLSWVRQQLDR